MNIQELQQSLIIELKEIMLLGPFLMIALALAIGMAIWLIRDFYYAFRYRKSQVSPMGEELRSPKTLIVMIHGTWGRRTRFIQEKNRLHAQLKSMLVDRAPQFCRLEWSGANLIFARRHATETLVKDLKTRIERTASLRSITLIGHSHGGNLAYDAARQLIAERTCRSRSAEVVDGVPEISVAALATPFLIEQTNTLPLSQAMVTLLVIATTCALLIPEGNLFCLNACAFWKAPHAPARGTGLPSPYFPP